MPTSLDEHMTWQPVIMKLVVLEEGAGNFQVLVITACCSNKEVGHGSSKPKYTNLMEEAV
jgi:hypothetical protein